MDDDEITLCLLEEVLKASGYEVVTASDGQEAWEILQKSYFGMVISDWEMPRMNGIELCRKIRSAGFVGYVYVILLTSHNRQNEIVAGLKAGADDYVTKPFDKTELSVRVKVGERLLSLETQSVTIFALAKLAEFRDPETGLHLERMRNYSRFLAMELGKIDNYKEIINHDYTYTIYLTSPLHDIGKVGIPDSILLKPGKHTKEEFEVMKSHTEKGAEVLSASLDQFPGNLFLEIARDIAWCHHEKYDGTGYPRELKGEEIPLAGRIVSLADVYDALTTERVYKKAFTHSAARSIILDDRGRHFHPDIVDAFLAAEQDFIKTCREMK